MVNTNLISAAAKASTDLFSNAQHLLAETYLEDLSNQEEDERIRPSQAADIGNYRFDVDTFPNFHQRLRLHRGEFRLLVTELKLIGLNSHYDIARLSVSLEEALAICLNRLAYPVRLTDMALIFGRSPSALSEIFNAMLKVLHHTLRPLLDFHREYFPREDMQMWADAIRDKCAPLKACVGFIDGSFRETCRPSVNQDVMYTGEHQAHGWRFQGITTPNGLTRVLLGPFAGYKNDNVMIKESQILEKFMKYQNEANIAPYVYFYGDSGYCPAPLLVVPYPRRTCSWA